MRVLWSFIFHESECGPEAIAKVVAHTGKEPLGPSWRFGLYEHDPRLPGFRSFLENAGLRPQARFKAPGLNEYRLDRTCYYTDHDLDQYQYLRVWGEWVWPACSRNAEGLVPLVRGSFPKKRHQRERGVYHSRNLLIVSSVFKSLMEREGLERLLFLPTVVLSDSPTELVPETPSVFKPRDPPPRRLEWSEIGEEPWWEMTSDLVLPPVSPSVPLESISGGVTDRIHGVRMDMLSCGELTYRDEDLRRVEPFDAALTVERWESPRDEARSMIVSQRFRQAARRNGLSIPICCPVHVEGRPEPDNLDPPEKTPVEEYVEAPPDGEEEY